MTKQTDQKLDWVTIDPSTLSAPIQKQYERYREAYREMKAEREAFESAMRAASETPKGFKLVIGYNFGKLSVALAPDTGKPAASAKSALSLSAFLASQSGRRT